LTASTVLKWDMTIVRQRNEGEEEQRKVNGIQSKSEVVVSENDEVKKRLAKDQLSKNCENTQNTNENRGESTGRRRRGRGGRDAGDRGTIAIKRGKSGKAKNSPSGGDTKRSGRGKSRKAKNSMSSGDAKRSGRGKGGGKGGASEKGENGRGDGKSDKPKKKQPVAQRQRRVSSFLALPFPVF